MKKVLITGANSYVGTSFENWANQNYQNQFSIDTLDMINEGWKNKDFSAYDVVFHVAGLAHADVGKVSEEIKQKYYRVNTELAIETARKAKVEGVKQFVFMSSMIIYGDSAPYGKKKVITTDTEPNPANFYGDSKWQADKGVRTLADETFKVAVLRPPMIYGRDSKGNYPLLAKLAKNLLMFPKVENERSMLYVGNLCEFLCQIMLLGEGGIYFPQNAEYTNTCKMVQEISKVYDKKMLLTKLLNPFVLLGTKMPGKISRMVNKAFGNMSYDFSMSNYPNISYQRYDFKTSILETEKESVK